MIEISAFGAIIGLLIAIILILRKVPPVIARMAGALIGGLLGGANIVETVNFMIDAAEGIMPPVLRILAAGVLAGILIESRAAQRLAQFTVSTFGHHRALLALAISTMLLTSVG